MPKESISAPAIAYLIELSRAAPASPRRDEALSGLQLLREQAQRPPLIFWLDMPGYITLGREGDTQTFEHPEYAGVDYAWRILIFGPKARSCITAEDILETPGLRPANALRNALTVAADWIEYRAHCVPLAVVVRSISIAKDGTIHAPTNRPYIDLR